MSWLKAAYLVEVEVGEDAHAFGEALDLEHGKELEGLHFEADGAVDGHEHDVGYVSHVEHAADVVGALIERDALALAGSDGDRA